MPAKLRPKSEQAEHPWPWWGAGAGWAGVALGGWGGGDRLSELESQKSGLMFGSKHCVWVISPSHSSSKIRIAHSPLAERAKVNRRFTEVDIPK